MSRSREKGWERKRKGKGVEQEQEQGQGQRREQGREPGREPGQEQAGQAAGGGLFVCARKGAGDHQMRGGWGPSSDVILAVKQDAVLQWWREYTRSLGQWKRSGVGVVSWC